MRCDPDRSGVLPESKEETWCSSRSQMVVSSRSHTKRVEHGKHCNVLVVYDWLSPHNNHWARSNPDVFATFSGLRARRNKADGPEYPVPCHAMPRDSGCIQSSKLSYTLRPEFEARKIVGLIDNALRKGRSARSSLFCMMFSLMAMVAVVLSNILRSSWRNSQQVRRAIQSWYRARGIRHEICIGQDRPCIIARGPILSERPYG